MGFEFYKESYAGAIKEISIGEGSKAVTVGGETCYPFYHFEGLMPHKPKIAMEVWDIKPEDWSDAAMAPFKDVIEDSAAWAKKCVNDYGAKIIVLQLKSIDPNGVNATPEEASSTVQKVLSAIDVPLIIWGVANAEKDESVFKRIAEDCQNYFLTFGPVEDKNHKSIGAAAMGYGHALISSSPIDVNLAKQVNILLENLGMPMDKVLIDPTTGGLGYGLEYTYSVMERLRMAALAQGDDKLQMPIVNNLGNEIWKCKEAKQGENEAPLLGDPEKRGILLEAVSAITYLMAGSDLLIMRHPEAIRLTQSYIDLITNGGDATEIRPISKKLDSIDIDFASLSPAPDLTISEEKSPEKLSVKKKVSLAQKSVKAKNLKGSEKPKKTVEKIKADISSDTQNEDKLKEIAEAKIKKELELKAIFEAKIKEEAEAKRQYELKIEAEEKAKKDAKLKAQIEAEAKEVFDREAKEQAIKEKRIFERLKIEGSKKKKNLNNVSKNTPALEQKNDVEKILYKLKWVHKRVKLYNWET